MSFAPSEDSDQPRRPPSLIRAYVGAQWVAKDPSFLHADSEGSDQTGIDAQADQSLRWVYRSFCWFCHEAAQIRMKQKYL